MAVIARCRAREFPPREGRLAVLRLGAAAFRADAAPLETRADRTLAAFAFGLPVRPDFASPRAAEAVFRRAVFFFAERFFATLGTRSLSVAAQAQLPLPQRLMKKPNLRV